MSFKSFTRRDSATALLRKMGINSRDYNLFIAIDQYNMHEVDVGLAKKHLADLAAQMAPKAEVKADKKVAGVEKVIRRTVSTVAREMILAGNDNATVWTAIKDEFELDDKKRGYPAWYRFQLRKQGHQV